MSTTAVSLADVDVVMRVDGGEGKDGNEEYDDAEFDVWGGCSSVSQVVSAASTVMQVEQDGVEA